MKPQLITVKARRLDTSEDPVSLSIRAVVRGELALHPCIHSNRDGHPAPTGPDWTVTHIPTGRRIHRSPSLLVARRLLRLLGTFDFWSAIAEQGSFTSERREQTIEAIRKAYEL